MPHTSILWMGKIARSLLLFGAACTVGRAVEFPNRTELSDCLRDRSERYGPRMRMSSGGDLDQRVDLVISWYAAEPQSDVKSEVLPGASRKGPSASFLYRREGTAAALAPPPHLPDEEDHTNRSLFGPRRRLDNNAEIKYLLRSLEKTGVLDWVGKVYIMMDASSLAKNGAPRMFEYGDTTGIYVVTDRSLMQGLGGQLAGERWAADGGWLAYHKRWQWVHLIPGLSRYYITLPDDNLFIGEQKVQPDWFFEREPDEGGVSSAGVVTGGGAGENISAFVRPIIYNFGSVVLGDCGGMGPVGGGHGPVMADSCAWGTLAERLTEEKTTNKHGYEAICCYSHMMVRSLGATQVGYGGKCPNHPGGVPFFLEHHTNGRKGVDPEKELPKAVVVNLQGDSISDEYPAQEADNQLWRQWYRTALSGEGKFEKK